MEGREVIEKEIRVKCRESMYPWKDEFRGFQPLPCVTHRDMQHPGMILRGIVSVLFPAPQDLTLLFTPVILPTPLTRSLSLQTVSSLHVPATVQLVGRLADSCTG